MHRVDITEGASSQFLTWIFNFGSYGQLRAVRGKNPIMNYEQLLSSVFSCFHGPKTNNQPFKKSCGQLSKGRQKLDIILENKVV